MDSKNLIEVKEKIKRDLINYYDSLKSDIDIDIQETLIKESTLNENLKNELIEINKKLIDKVDLNLNQSMDEINKYFSSLLQLTSLFSNINDLNNFFDDSHGIFLNNSNKIDLTSIKMTALNKYCIYINRAKINAKFANGKFPIGILISFDWYPTENQLNYAK
jgi:hypothetical protein